MKKVLISLLSLCLCIFCQSCQNEDVEDVIIKGVNANVVGTLLDGGQISDINLYCIENNKSTTGDVWYEYYPKVKTVKDYNSFMLNLMLHRNAHRYSSDNKEEMTSIRKIESDYEKERSRFIVESYNKSYQKGCSEWPVLFTAFINGDFSITCDKILFGEQPGTNLISYFSVISPGPCVPIGVENPQFLYDFGADIPTEAAKLFLNETWLKPNYYLEFSKQPSEKYEELTLFVSLPMTIEHIRDYAVSKYKGVEHYQNFSEREFSSKCQIKFNWD